jgi:hypothetical protein
LMYDWDSLNNDVLIPFDQKNILIGVILHF